MLSAHEARAQVHVVRTPSGARRACIWNATSSILCLSAQWEQGFRGEPGLCGRCAALSHSPPGQVGLALLPVPVWGQRKVTPCPLQPYSVARALLCRRRLEASADIGRGGVQSRFPPWKPAASCVHPAVLSPFIRGPFMNHVCYA